jgi:ABC transport system ATP-binding/permease protein
VTHDRYVLDRVSTVVLGLDGLGSAGLFADYSQWESWQEAREQSARNGARTAARAAAPAESAGRSSGKKKLSYLEAREYDTIEQRVAEAELVLQEKRVQVEDPGIASDGPRLVTAHAEMEEAQDKVDRLYARWAELEKKKT